MPILMPVLTKSNTDTCKFILSTTPYPEYPNDCARSILSAPSTPHSRLGVFAPLPRLGVHTRSHPFHAALATREQPGPFHAASATRGPMHTRPFHATAVTRGQSHPFRAASATRGLCPCLPRLVTPGRSDPFHAASRLGVLFPSVSTPY